MFRISLRCWHQNEHYNIYCANLFSLSTFVTLKTSHTSCKCPFIMPMPAIKTINKLHISKVNRKVDSRFCTFAYATQTNAKITNYYVNSQFYSSPCFLSMLLSISLFIWNTTTILSTAIVRSQQTSLFKIRNRIKNCKYANQLTKDSYYKYSPWDRFVEFILIMQEVCYTLLKLSLHK